MAVLLGEIGKVELKRVSEDFSITGVVRPSDVNSTRNRFSFIFPTGSLVSGDRVWIRNTEGTNLEFVSASAWPDNTKHPDGVFYIHIDEAGGVRLYGTFSEAVAGEVLGRNSLDTISADVPIRVTLQDAEYRVLGQVTNFELNTERESVDTTSLSDDFRRNVSGLISGSGRLTAFFDYEYREGDTRYGGSPIATTEAPIFINQLVLRTTTGSTFEAKFTLIGTGPKPAGDATDVDDQVWYEVVGRVTNAGVEFSPTEPIRVTMDFVTTGPIQLKTQFVSNYLLQEDFGKVRLEAQQSTGDGFIEVEQQE